MPKKPSKKAAKEPCAIRGVHLDLKYHMPNKKYMLDWLKRLPGYGINAILLEYEDKFPFRKYPFLADPDAFSPDELRQFLATARQSGLMVIPLVQTFAHLEFALAHPELAHLREKPEIMTKICALKPEASLFVKDLLEEVLAFHKEDKYIHLGGDEVWHTGWCAQCQERINQTSPIQWWVDHEKQFIAFALSQGKRPIVWDDIFWQDFKQIDKVGLPPETILHAWNYGITKLQAKDDGASDIEMGGAGKVLEQVEIYRKAGFDSVAGPCYNYGQLFTRHTHSLLNTQVWAQKIRSGGMLGMLNTAWAVFHLPLQVLNLYVAATGEFCRKPDTALDTAWQEQWLEREFGALAKGVPEALEALGALWEIPMPAYGRSFTPLPFCYMNMVLHYPGRHEDRKLRGPYPLDWNEIDFCAMYRKGVEESKKYPEQAKLYAVLDEKLAAFPKAVAALQALAAKAGRNADEARLLAVFAEFKLAALRVFSHLLRGDGDERSLKKELERLDQPLQAALAQAWEPVGRKRMWRAWWEPLYRAL